MRVGRPKLLWIAIGLLVLAVAIQLVPVERSNPPVETDVGAPPEVARILRRSCYDCHSHETRWPWYAYVAPASWLVASDVEEGRDDLNFSAWPEFDFEEQEHALDEIRKHVKSGDMPLQSYLWVHPSARLNDEERRLLLDWAAVSEPPGDGSPVSAP